MTRYFWRVVTASSMAILMVSSGAIAQPDTLTRAEVYRLQRNVQLLLRNQSPRPARLADILRPLDALRTAQAAIAELLFNEGSIARVDQNTTFRFESGMRRFQLSNRVALNETIFVLDDGTALILSPPASVGTQIRTPNSTILIRATAATAHSTGIRAALRQPSLKAIVSQAEELTPPPEGSSAVMVTYDATRRSTQVFALTDGDITVTAGQGRGSVSLQGGQTVAVLQETLGRVQEFDLNAFYQAVALAAGLGPGQEPGTGDNPPAVEATIAALRPDLLTAIRNQERRQAGFRATFLQDALSGSEGDFDGQRGRPAVTIINPQVTLGTFTRTGENQATFTDTSGNQIPIQVDFGDRTITIGNQQGTSSSAGLSGNNAVGTVVLPNGQIIRIDVFGVNGEEPAENVPYRGSLTQGIVPDR